MNQSIHDFFKSVASQNYDTRFEGINGTYEFKVEDAGSWYLTITDGAVSITDKKMKADCIVGTNEADFRKIVEGKQNLLTAFMQGRVTLSGDMNLAQKLYAITREKNPLPGRTQKTRRKKS